MPDHKPDLHVQALNYVLEDIDDLTYAAPPPVGFETANGRYRLADGRLRCELKAHFADVALARAAIEPAFQAWMLLSELQQGRPQLRFKFESPEVIDRAPLKPGEGRMRAYLTGLSALSAVGTVRAHVTRKTYPEPPANHFTLTPNFRTLTDRVRRYRQGQESIQSMGYFVLTMIEAYGPGRTNAAQALAIDLKILNKLGELTSTRGDALTARKASAANAPLTGAESAWIEAAVRELVLRTADNRPAAARPALALADLPPL